MRPKRAILSVSDKRGVTDFARALADGGWQILSTGGTARALREAGVSVTEVARVTGHAEMMRGRVKTLHPAVHAGILARRHREDDMAALDEQGYGPVDLVAVNLYPFRETVAAGDVPVGEAMEQVDIGGPTMLRAAAKNHRDVWAVVDPADYGRVLEAVDGDGDVAEPLRRELAAKVFGHVSAYDAAIARYLTGEAAAPGAAAAAGERVLPDSLSLRLERVQTLRYGENPDQEAAFYRTAGGEARGLAALAQLHGKELSYNNLLDLDGALLCLSPFAFTRRPACVIIKHTTPAGLAVGEDLESAYRRALRTDPMSSFGSVIAVNRPVDAATAGAMRELFIECIVAPGFSGEALDVLTGKKSLRLLTFPGVGHAVEGEPAGAGWWSSADEELRRAARFIAAQGRLPEARAVRSV
ncbi:MAG: bifunctional phosphoribosylaminoimidazolecarboxamide formyltransferase/IMP cyclohydrolase, partial [Gemmatimonadota bacterium]